MYLSRLVEKLCELGAPIEIPASDEILCRDLDVLVAVDPKRRMKTLQRAKREALRQYLADCVDQIAEASAGDAGEVRTLLGGFIGIEGESTTPPSHATLSLEFYGDRLPAKDVTRWTKLALAAAQPPSAADRDGAVPSVYFVSIGNPETVKIGYSANFRHRLRSLRTASPVEPDVLLTIAGTRQAEADLHRRFHADHIKREWFRLSPAIRAFIRDRK